MQPETPRPTPEQLPLPPTPGERIPSLPVVEGGVETGAERREQIGEARSVANDMATSSVPVAPAIPIVDTPLPTAPQTQVTGPLVAADEDVMEKEWVDKAKQILKETQDDPFIRSNKVNELQQDYLKKRYGKELGGQ